MTFLSLSKAITIGGAFFLYCGIATVGWIFFYTVLPETQGKTLEEMEGSFGGGSKTRITEWGKGKGIIFYKHLYNTLHHWEENLWASSVESALEPEPLCCSSSSVAYPLFQPIGFPPLDQSPTESPKPRSSG
ncbi:putative polyol transporter 2 [Spatholobus suberectus]|nr:putative polyol transporter 2 [Spatholobus suberectus]